jgi:mannose-1-phosphate guanylyltransferase
VKAVVLVGGSGTRLRPLTLALPKQMLPVAEVPMIQRVLAHLAENGVTEAVLSLGYRHEAFLEALPGARTLGLHVTSVIETEPLGTGGALGFAARTAGVDERFVAVNGDVLTDLDLGALVDFHVERGAEGTLALTPVDDSSPFGLVATDEDGRVVEFVEKPAAAQPGLVNAGTYVLEPSVLERIPENRPVSIEREVFPAIAAEGSLYAMVSSTYWTDTGTPERFLRCQLELIQGRRPGPPAPGAHHRGDGVWTIGSAVIDGEVQGPALIGTAAYVQSGATVERSVIGAGARVHEGARVRESVLLPGAVVRADATVELSLVGEQAVVGEKASLSGITVVGPNVEVEAGAHLHGVRLPGDD